MICNRPGQRNISRAEYTQAGSWVPKRVCIRNRITTVWSLWKKCEKGMSLGRNRPRTSKSHGRAPLEGVYYHDVESELPFTSWTTCVRTTYWRTGRNDAFIWAQAKDASPLTLTVHLPNLPLASSWTVTPRSDEFFCVVFHATGLTLRDLRVRAIEQIREDAAIQAAPAATRERQATADCLRFLYSAAQQVDAMLNRMADEGAI